MREMTTEKRLGVHRQTYNHIKDALQKKEL